MSLLASLSPAYRQSLASRKAGTDGDRPLSPYAEMMDTLQTLKKNDPDLYKRVRQETVTGLQAAIQTADAALESAVHMATDADDEDLLALALRERSRCPS